MPVPTRAVLTRRSMLAVSVAGAAAMRRPMRWPMAGAAEEATPVGGALDGGSLASMLRRAVEPVMDGGTGPTTRFAYANIARQLEVRGLRSLDEASADQHRLSEWSDGIDGLYVDDIVVRFAASDELWQTVGFSPAHIDQTMIIGDLPRITRIYRGRFDGAAILQALASSGYERVETPYGPVMSIGETGDFSLDRPTQRVVLASYNNIAVVGDALVIASPYLVDVTATMAVVAGDGVGLADDAAVATLLAVVDDELVSAAVVDGEYLSSARMAGTMRADLATPAIEDTLPPATCALLGITPGSMASRYTDEDDAPKGDHDDTAPRSALVIALLLGSPEAAAAAVPVIESRLAGGVSLVNGRPYAELFERWDVETVGGEPVVRLRIRGDRVGRIWLRMVLSVDLGFVTTA